MKPSKFSLAARPLAILATILSLAFGALAADKKTETVLYAFQGASDGELAFSGLTADSSGKLYGTTVYGGIVCGLITCGTVYQLAPPAAPGGQWTKNELYDFWVNPDDGYGPWGGVIFDKAGNLYGTTYSGGQNADCPNCGTVFQLAPPSAPGGSWTENVLHRFQDDPDGAAPWGPVIFDPAGNLYGTTSGGGPFGGSGAIFEMTPPVASGRNWTESVLYTFDVLHPGNGCGPMSGVIMDKAGDLYGTTEDCGTQRPHHCPGIGCGTVFKLAHPAVAGDPWRYKVLHLFQGSPSDGSSPMAGLVFDNAGNLYGTTSYGGLHRAGTVFKLTPPLWTETVIYNFAGGNDGYSPQGGLVFHNGRLYGTTVEGGVGCRVLAGGCGTVFQLTPQSDGVSWIETVIYRFHSGDDGMTPFGTLLFGKGDTLFGTTGYGGDGPNCQIDPNSCGTIFELAP